MRAQLAALGDVFRNPGLRRLQLAWLATSIGVWGGSVVLAVYAYDRGGSVAVGVMAVLRNLPGALAAPLLSLVADRHSRRTTLLAASAAQGLVVAAIASAVAADAPLAAVYVLVALVAVVIPAYKPAQTALLPHLARTPAELSAANVAASMVLNVGFVLGALFAGLLLSATSPAVALGALAGGFAAAIAALSGIGPDAAPEPDSGVHPAREAVEGFRTVASDADLRELVGITTALTFVDGAMDVLLVVAALGFLDLGDGGAGYLSALWGIGCVAGGPAVLGLLSRGRLTTGFTVGSVVVGGALAAMAGLPVLGVALVALLCFGAGSVLAGVAAEIFLQRLAADHVLARVFGVVEALSVAAAAAGSLGAGLLADAVGARPALLVLAALLPVVVVLRRARLAHLEAGAPVPERNYALLRAHPIFAPLPVATTERLAGSLEELNPTDGESVIAEGDPGDRFYLVVAGEVDAFQNGAFRRTMGPGEAFGEIALLRDVPRTATVRARSDVTLVALGRGAFLGAVTAQPRSARAATALAAGRLRPVTARADDTEPPSGRDTSGGDGR